jgi:RNA polymerase sigma-70 factor (ECF subfamily)
MLSTRRTYGLDTMSQKRTAAPKPAELGSHPGAAPTRSVFAANFSAARAGDHQHIGDLLQQYRNYLMVLAAAQIEPRWKARVSPSDIVQETMLRASRRFAQFAGQSEKEFLAWLRQILVSSLARFVEQHVLAAKRDVRRELAIEQFGAFRESLGESRSILQAKGETPSALARRSEDAAVLEQRLTQLPAVYRQVLVLRNLQGLTFEEVAARMDRTPGAVRMLWLRAIEKLRAIYRRMDQDDL